MIELVILLGFAWFITFLGLIVFLIKMKPFLPFLKAQFSKTKKDFIVYLKKNGGLDCFNGQYEAGGYNVERGGVTHSWILDSGASFNCQGVPVTIVWDSSGRVPRTDILRMQQKLAQMGIYTRKQLEDAMQPGKSLYEDAEIILDEITTFSVHDFYRWESTTSSMIAAHDEVTRANTLRNANSKMSGLLGQIAPVAIMAGMVVISAIIALVIIQTGGGA